MSDDQKISIIILAGGKSSRMGQDKGLMILNGKAMIENIISTAKKITDQIIIVANNPEYKKFGHKVIEDIFPGKGPLGGIYTGLKSSTTEKNIILSCDVPFIKKELLEFILSESGDNDITVPVFETKIHPLIGVYSKQCLNVILDNIQKDKLKVTGIFDDLVTKQIDVNAFDPSNFRNINSAEDL